MRPPVALTIAGSDSGGGAGVAADLKTFEAHGVWGTLAITAVTTQNTLGMTVAEVVPPRVVRAQIAAVADDIGVDAVKTGMLATAETVAAVAAAVREHGLPHLVVDPVLVSKHGDPLLVDDAIAALRRHLLPLAAVVTPNLPEASALCGFAVDSRHAMVAAARDLLALGPAVVVVKGGHLDDEGSPDLVLAVGGEPQWLDGDRLPVRHTHGTGCVLSAAITAELARGMAPADACLAAKHFVTRAIAAGIDLGGGIGPVNPGWQRLT